MKSKPFPSPEKMTMEKIISVCIIFVFLLTSFAGCGKLKSSPVSGLNQPEAPAPPEVNSQSETSTLPETVSQPDISNEVEPSQQFETSQPPQLPDPSELIQNSQISPFAQASQSLNIQNEDLNQSDALVPSGNFTTSNNSSEVETINPPVSSLPPLVSVPAHCRARRRASSSDKFACALVAGVPILLAWGITAAWNAYEEYCVRNSENGEIYKFYEQRWREKWQVRRSRQR